MIKTFKTSVGIKRGKKAEAIIDFNDKDSLTFHLMQENEENVQHGKSIITLMPLWQSNFFFLSKWQCKAMCCFLYKLSIRVRDFVFFFLNV